jgi:hypothetical protein
VAKTVVRAIVVDTLQSAILLGGNLIKKLKIQVDLDTQKVSMFRGENLMITNCVPWGRIQQSIAETSSKVDSLCMFSASIVNSNPSSVPSSSHKDPSFNDLLLADQTTCSLIPTSAGGNLSYPSSSCPLYTAYFDKNTGVLSSLASSSSHHPSYKALSEALLGLPS